MDSWLEIASRTSDGVPRATPTTKSTIFNAMMAKSRTATK
jgi:hypothetical protein